MKNSASVLLSFAQNAINSQAIKGGKSFSFKNFASPSILVGNTTAPSVLMATIDMANDAKEMLEASGLKNVKSFDNGSFPGMAIHEMGTARMGHDPKTSVLNQWNQVHSVPNVYVTDGACMTSAACVNPSLTYMALTARACDHAVSELKKQNI